MIPEKKTEKILDSFRKNLAYTVSPLYCRAIRHYCTILSSSPSTTIASPSSPQIFNLDTLFYIAQIFSDPPPEHSLSS